MGKLIVIRLLVASVILAGRLPAFAQAAASGPAILQPAVSASLPVLIKQQEEDSLVWKEAWRFIDLFNGVDTAAMGRFLPADFMLQWMHENFLDKRMLLNAMLDTAVHATLKHRIEQDARAVIRYSGDHESACLNTGFSFLDRKISESIKDKHGYGLSIMYFQRVNGFWRIKTVHLDIHCSLCNL